MENKTIKIYVQDRVVWDVEGLPENYNYEIIDDDSLYIYNNKEVGEPQ